MSSASSGSSAQSLGGGLERFLLVLMSFSRVCEDNRTVDLGGLKLGAMIDDCGLRFWRKRRKFEMSLEISGLPSPSTYCAEN